MPLSAEQIGTIVDRHAVPLQLWAGRRCAAAEDVVQEAFCRLAVLNPPPDKPVAWLYRVVRNVAETERLARKRRQAREQQAGAAESYYADPADQMCQNEVASALCGELRTVGPQSGSIRSAKSQRRILCCPISKVPGRLPAAGYPSGFDIT